MKKGIRIFLTITSLTITVTFALIAWFAWMGGYWENMPLFDYISGPKRFKQYVANPIPDYISNPRGGYSGFPQGQITTYFEFSTSPNQWAFIKDWNEINFRTESNMTDIVFVDQRVVLFSNEKSVSKVYKYGENFDRYLIIAEGTGKGLLFVP